MTAPTFTKEQLADLLFATSDAANGPDKVVHDVTAFALAQLDEKETAEAERDRLRAELREAEEVIRHVAHGDGYDCYRAADDPDRGRLGYNLAGSGDWAEFPPGMQPAVRRARERREA